MATKIPKAPSRGEEELVLHLTALKIPFIRHVRFDDFRKWEFDFVIPHHKNWEQLSSLSDQTQRRLVVEHGPGLFVAVEVDGGNRMVRNGAAVGRHTGEDDYRKLNAAAIRGWRVLRFTPAMVRSGEALAPFIPGGNGQQKKPPVSSLNN